VDIEFDETKRLQTPGGRGLDFLEAPRLFAGTSVTLLDDSRDYGEVRYLS
jgi:hypothetical protein